MDSSENKNTRKSTNHFFPSTNNADVVYVRKRILRSSITTRCREKKKHEEELEKKKKRN